MVGNQDNSSSGNGGCDDLFCSDHKLIDNSFLPIDMRQSVVAESQFMFKSQRVRSIRITPPGMVISARSMMYPTPVVRWFAHDGLPVQNILSDAVVEHALRSGIGPVFVRVVCYGLTG